MAASVGMSYRICCSQPFCEDRFVGVLSEPCLQKTMFCVELPEPKAKKRSPPSTGKLFPFPNSGQQAKCFLGSLKADCVEVSQWQDDLYRSGYYGCMKSGHQNEDGAEDKATLVLSFEEAYFLSYALGSLVVKDSLNQMLNLEQFWQKLVAGESDRPGSTPFPALYAAYHHFRTKGWVVKPGVKFGCDFLLYKEGPPHYHATYAVRVMSGIKFRPAPCWRMLAALNRTCVNAGKSALLCYVLMPEGECDFSLPTCIAHFGIQELLISRWVAAQERDEN